MDIKFRTGNVVSNPKGDLFIVSGVAKEYLIPFDHCGSSVHPQKTTVVDTYALQDEETGEMVEHTRLIAYGWSDYKLEALTLKEYFYRKTKDILGF